MRYFFALGIIFFIKLSSAYCQPKFSFYDVEAMVDGKMHRELTCDKRQVRMNSNILVDLWIYHINYHEMGLGVKSRTMGVFSHQYQLDDSRKDKKIIFDLGKNDIALPNVPLVLAYLYAHHRAFPRTYAVYSEEGKGLITFNIMDKHVMVKTPLGIFSSIQFEGRSLNRRDRLVYWLRSTDYLLIKEQIFRDENSQFSAIITKESEPMACCWS